MIAQKTVRSRTENPTSYNSAGIKNAQTITHIWKHIREKAEGWEAGLRLRRNEGLYLILSPCFVFYWFQNIWSTGVILDVHNVMIKIYTSFRFCFQSCLIKTSDLSVTLLRWWVNDTLTSDCALHLPSVIISNMACSLGCVPSCILFPRKDGKITLPSPFQKNDRLNQSDPCKLVIMRHRCGQGGFPSEQYNKRIDSKH